MLSSNQNPVAYGGRGDNCDKFGVWYTWPHIIAWLSRCMASDTRANQLQYLTCSPIVPTWYQYFQTDSKCNLSPSGWPWNIMKQMIDSSVRHRNINFPPRQYPIADCYYKYNDPWSQVSWTDQNLHTFR